jgi:hypothetical protein
MKIILPRKDQFRGLLSIEIGNFVIDILTESNEIRGIYDDKTTSLFRKTS